MLKMNYQFADRISALQPSAIREILKFTSMPGVISFAAGNPSAEAFPAKEIGEISARLLDENPVGALQYSITEGYAPLRETMKKHMTERHNSVKGFDQLIITSGAQQVMELVVKSLCNEGDCVICESPSFIGSLNAFRSYNLKLCGVPVESDGINIELLEQALKTEKNVRVIYTIPNFQNPSGVTMSLEKRGAVYALAKKNGVMILEDNPYGELRYVGEALPNIKSLDEDGIVIYAGSFSKVLSPGMRVGYAIAPAPVISKLVVCKQVSDVHSNIWAQILADEFMNTCDYDAHIRHIREIYTRKSRIMTDALDSPEFEKISYNPVSGGLFVWCTLPAGVNMPEFCKKAVRNNVAVVPGNAFLMDESEPCSSFRMNFSTPTDSQLTEGMEILAGVVKSL